MLDWFTRIRLTQVAAEFRLVLGPKNADSRNGYILFPIMATLELMTCGLRGRIYDVAVRSMHAQSRLTARIPFICHSPEDSCLILLYNSV
jgi:hypothetical protein